MSDSSDYQTLSKIIRGRATTKVLSKTGAPIDYPQDVLARGDLKLQEILETAGWAPFHYPRNESGVPEPWRFCWLKAAACRDLAKLVASHSSLKPGAKFPGFLNSCCSAVICCWIPQEKTSTEANLDSNKLVQVNEEHLAATSCAVQNLLLLCQSLHWNTYWSSGRILGDSALRPLLKIPFRHKIIGTVFIQYQNGNNDVTELIPGKLRRTRTGADRWVSCLDHLT